MRHIPARTERIFAARLLRETLIGALRQEGHAVSTSRFFAWFAGLTTLVDPSERTIVEPRAPRIIVSVILNTLSYSTWTPLAALATRVKTAFLATQDMMSEPAGETCALIDDAADLLTTIEPAPLPFAMLSQLHHAVARSSTFAPGERSATPIVIGDRRLIIERPATLSPRWALEVQYSEHMRSAGFLYRALPMTGLIRLDALSDSDDGESRILRAAALRDLVGQLSQHLEESYVLAGRSDATTEALRSTSRVPVLFELLAGFGAMRSSQLETLLGATRLGVRQMLTTLEFSGMLDRSVVGGVQLYHTVTPRSCQESHAQPLSQSAFSDETRAEFDSSMADIDALLARLGVEIENEGG